MPKTSVLLSFIVLFLILPRSLHAAETEIIQDKEVAVQFEKGSKNTAQEILNIYPDVKAELEKTIKWKIDFRPTVIIVRERKTFQKIVNSSSVVAVAISRNNLIIIDNSRMNEYPFTLELTLKHELCHLMLHNYIKGENLPKWLNEGISQWISGGIAEIITGEKKDVLKQAVLSGRLISLRDLAGQFPEDEKSFSLSYEESKSVVEYIIGEFGINGLIKVLDYLRNDDDIDTAIFKSLSVPLNELESRWHDNLRKKVTWVAYLSSNLYNVLFFIAALITIYGFIRLLIRRWTYKDEEEEPSEDF